MVLSGNALWLSVLWSSEDASCTEDSTFAYKKNKFGSNRFCQYQKTPILQLVPSSLSFFYVNPQKILFCLVFVLPWWLRLHPRAAELHTSLCSHPFKFWYPTLHAESPTLVWHHHPTLYSDWALCVQAPNPRSASETRACSFLLLFSAGTYVLLKKGWKRCSKNGSRSLWRL